MVRDRCSTLFSSPPPLSRARATPPLVTAPGRACILYTATVPTPWRGVAKPELNSWRLSSVAAYNAGVRAAWGESHGPPLALVDAAALSLLPAVMNGICSDGVHYGTDPNPFSSIVWQMTLHIALNNGSQVVAWPLLHLVSGSNQFGGLGLRVDSCISVSPIFWPVVSSSLVRFCQTLCFSKRRPRPFAGV